MDHLPFLQGLLTCFRLPISNWITLLSWIHFATAKAVTYFTACPSARHPVTVSQTVGSDGDLMWLVAGPCCHGFLHRNIHEVGA